MSIRDNYLRLLENIETIKNRRGIDYQIDIIAVTKTKPADVIREVVQAGAFKIGENRVQEAESKFAELSSLNFEKHLIGHLQENKANKAARLFDWVQSIDKWKVADKLNRKLEQLNKTMPILIEVNTSGEESKYGITPEETETFMGRIKEEATHMKISGLMTIAPFTSDEKNVRDAFKLLYNIREKMSVIYPNLDLSVLSMGMSDDYEWAIEEGSTMIRPGRVLFGAR